LRCKARMAEAVRGYLTTPISQLNQ
jgi:hypothetical protein